MVRKVIEVFLAIPDHRASLVQLESEDLMVRQERMVHLD
jgi:hypothetical protein